MKMIKLPLAAFLLLALSACALLGGGGNDRRATVYVLDPRVEARPDWPNVDWQLALGNADASRLTDSLRIAVRPAGHEMQVYKGAAWGKMPTDMVEDAILRTMEDSGRIPAIARQGSGIGAEYKLVLDLRRFESDYAGQPVPSARIELNAKLLHTRDQRVVAARTFRQAVPAASTAVVDVVDAFEQSLATVTAELVGWVLQSGAAHGHVHPEPAPAARPVVVPVVPVPVPAR
ncbi:ABC-type transport auxiliary lipoprotein family protein [Lysobacter sp. GX 14042]|uniref:ABC-type transport auxiliary lipoprotein family protein n=1 Tax=Lysobacter sp. GX 14042 TaxID=2907155 RepID=UPI001F166548|nr:ABC-type transport auxiliary lipoprotein family protein [Lysobacter sp. GX 14042]MCE7033559.1 ABC-type transport auxiliary lipoprotein family protein [Lysobacter sp. GX 14042]